MSQVTRRKHVMREMMKNDFDLPKKSQKIVRVTSSRGNNLHEVESPDDVENFLVSMPTKLRRNVWIHRGNFIIVEPIKEGNKVKAEICKILTPEHVKEYTKAGIWPTKFTKKREHSMEDLDGEQDDNFIVRNLNRPELKEDNSDSEDDNDSEEDDEETDSCDEK